MSAASSSACSVSWFPTPTVNRSSDAQQQQQQRIEKKTPLLDISPDLQYRIFSDYLGLKEVAMVEIAIASTPRRAKFMHSFRISGKGWWDCRERQKEARTKDEEMMADEAGWVDEKVREKALEKKRTNYLKWLLLRNIQVAHLDLRPPVFTYFDALEWIGLTVLEVCGPSIRSIDILLVGHDAPKWHRKVLQQIAKHCPGLEILDLRFFVWNYTDCDDDMQHLASQLVHLERVCIRQNDYISTRTIESFLSCCPALERLKIVNCPRATVRADTFGDIAVAKYIAAKNLLSFSQIRTGTTCGIAGCIHRHRGYVRTDISDETLLTIARVFTKLEEISLSFDESRHLSHEGVRAFARSVSGTCRVDIPCQPLVNSF